MNVSTAFFSDRMLKVFFSILLFLPPVLLAEEQHSKAEILLFETDHLKPIKQPETLHYAFKKRGTLEEGFEDTVKIKIDKVKSDGNKAVSSVYLTGKNHQRFETLEEARGNPVLLFFLERDIHEMQRLTKGNWRYFQKRIRLALADDAEVRPITFLYDGKEAHGHEIKIAPYADDPQKSRYEQFAGKSYVFAVSEAVPGGVYQIKTVVPASSGEPLMEETLTFDREEKSKG
jgi:hypothetical protein